MSKFSKLLSGASCVFSLALVLLPSHLMAQNWVNPNQVHDFSYVFAPGLGVSEINLAFYCPEFTASTDEVIKCHKGIETIQKNVSSCNFAEIKFYSSWYYYSTFPIFYLLRKHYGIKVDNLTSTKKTLSCHCLNFFKINLGQDTDIAIYGKRFQEHLNKQAQGKSHKTILYGVSRGSATVFNYAAQNNQSQNISAIVCEAIFDSVEGIHQNISPLSRLKIKLLKRITEFKDDGICPLKCLDQLPKDLPIALVTSLADESVPHQCTWNLYKQLIQNGFKNVHILILEKSAHPAYPIGSEKEKYQSFVHAFYKKYNLPYIAEFAEQGKALLQESQPTTSGISAGFHC